MTTHDAGGRSGVLGLDAASGEPVWETPVAAVPERVAGSRAGGPFSRIVGHDGKVYAPANTGELTVIDVEKGEPLWELHDGDRIAVPAVADGVLLFAAYEGADTPYLHAVDAEEGYAYWHRPLGSHLRFQPAVSDGKVLIVQDGRLLALDASTGNERWSFGFENGSIAHQPVLTSKMVYVTNGAEIVCLEDEPGRE